ncbi:MAG: hypothetical protein KBI46_00105 [Phycisphaerae bacterium]|nr:hypothetical protein [Phycisphaerae bacterium]
MRKWKVVLMTIGILLMLQTVPAATVDFDGTAGDGTSWEDPGNWSGGPTGATGLPGSGDYVVISGDIGGETINMDAGTWQYFVDNSLLTGGSAGEYRTQSIRLGWTHTSTLNVDIGDGNIWRTTNSTLQGVGSASGSNGTWNIYSGDIRIESSSFRIAEKAGSAGLVNIAGSANTRLIIHRETGGVSMQVGTGGAGIFQIDSGKFRTRAGVTVGSNGLFRVLGSDVTEVSIGDESTLDGNWTQNAGGILEFGIDAGGVTPIVIADKGGSGTFAIFDDGSLLNLHFLDAPIAGTWTLMEVKNGFITDNGLMLAAGVDPGWSFSIDNSGPNGLLTAAYVPEPAAATLLGFGSLILLRKRK